MTAIVWFRQDLRVADNPALAAAAAQGAIVPLFILDDDSPAQWRSGGASRWWLGESLASLRAALGGLVLLRGDASKVLPRFAAGIGAQAVFWNRCYEPHAIRRDSAIKAALSKSAIAAESFNGSLLFEPWEIATGRNEPFKVFTPFWRTCRSRLTAAPQPPPVFRLRAHLPAGEKLEDWALSPERPNWAQGWNKIWRPGECGAFTQLDLFLETGLKSYGSLRDRPDRDHVSRLSPHLHFGEISPRTIWAKLARAADHAALKTDAEKFRSELGWREFAHHLLFHYPDLPEQNFKPAFDAFPWRDNNDHLRAWQRGRTGYPLVDAGMRELWQTGFMHNRIRMVTASFLIKHLRIDWRRGAAWFWDTLVDANLANNTAGWQWVAGSGADASPYFRIFNPVTQGRKFDPDGAYVRRWCPELATLPDQFIHAPFEAPPGVLAQSGVELGVSYPHPIVDHDAARRSALEGYALVRAGRV
jgi:deoxyribodipyrimidine photo-lyase